MVLGKIVLVSIVLALVAVSAAADTISYNASRYSEGMLVLSDENIGPAAWVPQFSPNLGSLQGVSMLVDSRGLASTDTYQNLTDHVVTIDTGKLDFDLSVFGAGGMSVHRWDSIAYLSVPSVTNIYPGLPSNNYPGEIFYGYGFAPRMTFYTAASGDLGGWIGNGPALIGASAAVNWTGKTGELTNVSTNPHIGGAVSQYVVEEVAVTYYYTPIPEPATLTLLCSALLGLTGVVYLRRRTTANSRA